jgi:hypothetical protein
MAVVGDGWMEVEMTLSFRQCRIIFFKLCTSITGILKETIFHRPSRRNKTSSPDICTQYTLLTHHYHLLLFLLGKLLYHNNPTFCGNILSSSYHRQLISFNDQCQEYKVNWKKVENQWDVKVYFGQYACIQPSWEKTDFFTRKLRYKARKVFVR